jgi:hypothetical protein
MATRSEMGFPEWGNIYFVVNNRSFLSLDDTMKYIEWIKCGPIKYDSDLRVTVVHRDPNGRYYNGVQYA